MALTGSDMATTLEGVKRQATAIKDQTVNLKRKSGSAVDSLIGQQARLEPGELPEERNPVQPGLIDSLMSILLDMQGHLTVCEQNVDRINHRLEDGDKNKTEGA